MFVAAHSGESKSARSEMTRFSPIGSKREGPSSKFSTGVPATSAATLTLRRVHSAVVRNNYIQPLDSSSNITILCRFKRRAGSHELNIVRPVYARIQVLAQLDLLPPPNSQRAVGLRILQKLESCTAPPHFPTPQNAVSITGCRPRTSSLRLPFASAITCTQRKGLRYAIEISLPATKPTAPQTQELFRLEMEEARPGKGRASR